LYTIFARVTQQIVLIIEAQHFSSYIHNSIHHSLSSISLYPHEITGGHQCGFRSNRSATDLMCSIRQIIWKKWVQNEAVHQLFIDVKKAYDLVRKEVLYNIIFEFGIPLKIEWPKKCLNETYNRVCVGNHLSDTFLI
jgi:hypothetical protein